MRKTHTHTLKPNTLTMSETHRLRETYALREREKSEHRGILSEGSIPGLRLSICCVTLASIFLDYNLGK